MATAMAMKQIRDRYVDWRVWYEAHKDDGRDLEMTVKFQAKMIEGCLELIGLILRNERDDSTSSLYTPTGIRFHG